MSTLTDHLMIIDGQRVPSIGAEWIEVENPSTKEMFARIPRGRSADVDAAVAAASRAATVWANTPSADRAAYLVKIADRVEAEQEEIARTISEENGNALRTQSRPETAQVVDYFRYIAGLGRELKGTASSFSANTLDYTRREPFGVVGAIVPWNAPLTIAMLKIAPALLTGNTLVLKAAEGAPLAVLRLGAICNDILPAGVINVLTGYGAEAGQPLAEHRDVRKVSFTGSTAVGKLVLAAASNRVAAVTLELGGKSPQIVFPDVDIDATVDGVITGMRFTRQGQSCTAGTRVFVHEAIADEFLEALKTKLKALKIGNALDPDSDAGSLVSAKQFERVCGYVKGAIERHPEALALGGLPPTEGPLSTGYYFEPTIFVDLPDDDPLVRDEVFGPVMALSRWKDESEVIRRANDTEYGLSAFVWSRAGGPALRVAHALQAGWVMVNKGGGQSLGQSFGGYKQSGKGREFSLEGMLAGYTQTKQVSMFLGTEGGDL